MTCNGKTLSSSAPSSSSSSHNKPPIQVLPHHAHHPHPPSDSAGTWRRTRSKPHFTQATVGRHGCIHRARHGRHRVQARNRIREPARPSRRIAFDCICTGFRNAGSACCAEVASETLGGHGVRIHCLRFASFARYAHDRRSWCSNLVALLRSAALLPCPVYPRIAINDGPLPGPRRPDGNQIRAPMGLVALHCRDGGHAGNSSTSQSRCQVCHSDKGTGSLINLNTRNRRNSRFDISQMIALAVRMTDLAPTWRQRVSLVSNFEQFIANRLLTLMTLWWEVNTRRVKALYSSIDSTVTIRWKSNSPATS